MSEEGNRVYTLAKTDPAGNPTFSAHPARWSYGQMKLHTVLQQYSYITKPRSSLNYETCRFSPEDKYSRQRITIKKRFNLLPTQGPAQEY